MKRGTSSKSILILDLNPVIIPHSVYPLGAAMLADLANAYGFKPVCRSWRDFQGSTRNLAEIIDSENWCLIAASIRNIDNTRGLDTDYYFPRILPLLKVIAQRCQDRCVLGGAGFSLFPESILKHSNLRHGVVGRDLSTWRTIIETVLQTEFSFPVDTCEEGVLHSLLSTQQEPMKFVYADSLEPLPMEDWFPKHNKWDRVGFNTQSGCSQKCIYCSYPTLSGNIKVYREIDETLEFVQRWQGFGFKTFDLVDDVFNDNLKHALVCCNVWATLGFKFEWKAYMRPNGIDATFSFLLASAGCKEAILGTDSLSDVVLEHMHKGFDVASVAKAVNLLQESGIKVCITLIVGSEFDNPNTIRETAHNLNLINPDIISVQYGIRILPNSPLAVEQGKTEKDLLDPTFSVSKMISLKEARSIFEAELPLLERRAIA